MILVSLLLVGAYGLCCVAAGGLLLRGLRRWIETFSSPLAELAGAFLLGLAMLGNVWLVLSILPDPWFTWPMVLLVLCSMLLLGGRAGLGRVNATARQFGRSLQTLYADRFDMLEPGLAPSLRIRRFFLDSLWPLKILVPPALAVLLLYFFASSLPPKGDAEAFYMVLPKVIAQAGRLEIPPGWRSFMAVGLHGELHFAALLTVGPWPAAVMLVFAVSLAGVAMLIEIARRAGLGLAGRWVLVLLAVCSTAWTRVIPGGKVDLFGAALCLAALYHALAIRPGRWLGPSLLTGLLLGAGVIAKLTLGVTVVPMVALLVAWRVLLAEGAIARRLAVLVGSAAVVAIGAGVSIGVHMAKDAALFGDPWFPVFASAQASQSGEMLQRPAYLVDKLRRLYPLALFLGKMNMFGRLTAAALALLPVAILLPRPRGLRGWLGSTLVQVFVVALVGIVCWASLYFRLLVPRYFLPPLMLILLLPSAAAGHVLACPRIGRAIRFGVILVLVLALAERINRPKGHPGEGLALLLGSAELAEVVGPDGRMCLLANERAAGDDRILALTMYRFQLRPELIRTASSNTQLQRLAELPAGADRWRWLEANRWRVILVGPRYGQIAPDGRLIVHSRDGKGLLLDSRTLPPDLTLIQAGVDSRRPGGYGVYLLRVSPAASQPTTGDAR